MCAQHLDEKEFKRFHSNQTFILIISIYVNTVPAQHTNLQQPILHTVVHSSLLNSSVAAITRSLLICMYIKFTICNYKSI